MVVFVYTIIKGVKKEFPWILLNKPIWIYGPFLFWVNLLRLYPQLNCKYASLDFTVVPETQSHPRISSVHYLPQDSVQTKCVTLVYGWVTI